MSEDKDTASGGGASAKRLSDAEFATAREWYELGSKGLIEIADELGISRQALSKRFKDAGAVKGSRAHEVAKAAGTAAKAAAAAVSERFADQRSEWIEETRISGVKVLRQIAQITNSLVQNEVKRTMAAGKMTVVGIEDDLKALRIYNRMLIENVEARLRVLRADDHVDEEDLPTLTIEDLTDNEILEHHKRTGAMPEDMTVEEMLAEEADLEIDDL